jgi:hypothetical protein
MRTEIGCIADFYLNGMKYRGFVHDVIGDWAYIVVLGCNTVYPIPVQYTRVHKEAKFFIDLSRD